MPATVQLPQQAKTGDRVRMPKFQMCDDGKERAVIQVDHRLTMAQLTNLLANYIADVGIQIGDKHLSAADLRGTERLPPSRTLEILRAALQENGEARLTRDARTSEILRLWANTQVLVALRPSLRPY